MASATMTCKLKECTAQVQVHHIGEEQEKKGVKHELELNTCKPPPEIQKRTENALPIKRQEVLRWNGWGYTDTNFEYDPKTRKLMCSSKRYDLGEPYLSPETRQWLIDVLGMDLFKHSGLRTPQPKPRHFPDPVINSDFVSDVQEHRMVHSFDGDDRLFRVHGHTLHDIMTLRESSFNRIPDIVIWPSCHDDVVNVVRLATEHNVVLIPFGGGTNVTRALECNPDEKRMIISLDTSQMNRVLWVDKGNLVACCEAGIIGQDLGRELAKHGLTAGHEPDSYEFSSLGGWVATRASGMKKNQYGNIEDLVVHVRLVTPNGTLEKPNQAPRVSCGPDLNHVVLGSEGTLGVITEVIFKVRPLPEKREFKSFVFPTFQHGVDFMRAVARKRCQSASLRLIDNEQYKLGLLFKEQTGYIGSLIESLKMFYVRRIKGINMDTMCVCIAVCEGDADDVEAQQRKITTIAQNFEGFSAGSTNGQRGYLLTFVIAYVRDVCLSYNVLAESFETSVPWDRVANLCRNVKHTVARECKARGINLFQVSSRVTQVYDAGACVYFYFAFNADGIPDAIHAYEEIEEAARDEILACGGSLSHHHGVGKVRQKWFPKQVSPVGLSVYRAVKRQLDPNNIFASGNLWTAKSAL